MFNNYLSHSYRIIAYQDKYNSHKVETIKYVGFISINHSLTVYKKKYIYILLLLICDFLIKNFEKKKMQQN